MLKTHIEKMKDFHSFWHHPNTQLMITAFLNMLAQSYL